MKNFRFTKFMLVVSLGGLLLSNFSAMAAAESAAPKSYEEKLKSMQRKLGSLQLSRGEWAGINEGDPRWDSMFMVYTFELNRAGLDFVSQKDVDRVVNQTIDRLKTWRGFQANGWALHRGEPVSKSLTGSILLALNHVNPQLASMHFPSVPTKSRTQDMTVLDRAIFTMMQAPADMQIPPIEPSHLDIPRNSVIPNMSSLGYYRWGLAALTVWQYYDAARKDGLTIEPLTEDFRNKYRDLVSFPERRYALPFWEKLGSFQADFWARAGLVWLLDRPFGDGNPSPTLIVQQSLLAAHRAGVANLSAVLEQGWRYMDELRRPMRNGVHVFQPSISPIWDTARVLKAIAAIPKSQLVADLRPGRPSTKRALQFLLEQQDINGGDYRMATPNMRPGGWGFAYGSNKYPDSDDTAMVIESFIPYAANSPQIAEAIKKGADWLLQMQRPNGGFPAWDAKATGLVEFLIKNTSMLPNTSLEPQADVTARVLRSLKHVSDSGLAVIPPETFRRGCSFLERKKIQSSSGIKLWEGTWAVNYLYGSSEALSTMLQLGCVDNTQATEFLTWVRSVQNPDGGWGESIGSIKVKDFVQGRSTIAQTLGALQVLINYENFRRGKDLPSAMDVIEKGMKYYLGFVSADGDISDESDDQMTACYACPELFVRYDLIPLYMGTEVLGKFLNLRSAQ
jgi:hypothetical protein